MALVNPASLSTEERPIGLFTRRDLVVQESVYQGRVCWIVKDPLAMKYFRLQEAEYLVFEQLRNEVSYLRLKELLDRKFPQTTTRLETIQQLVVSLHRNGLMRSGSIGQAYPLRKQRNKEFEAEGDWASVQFGFDSIPGIRSRAFAFIHVSQDQLVLHVLVYVDRCVDLFSGGIVSARKLGRVLLASARLPKFLCV